MVLTITSKLQDQLPRKLTIITNGTATGQFAITFSRGEKDSCCWQLTYHTVMNERVLQPLPDNPLNKTAAIEMLEEEYENL